MLENKESQAASPVQEKQPGRSERSIKIMRILSTVFVVLGILGLMLPFLNGFLLRRNQAAVDLESITASQMAANAEEINHFPLEDIAEIGYVNFWPQLGKFHRDEIIGELIIPSEKIHLAIFESSKNENLLAGVGQLFSDRRMGEGNYAVSGHRASGKAVLLHNLMDVKEGATIYVSDKRSLYVYQVVNTVEKGVDAVHMLDEEQVENYANLPIISVMTCYNGKSSSRWFVVGRLVAKLPYSSEQLENEYQP